MHLICKLHRFARSVFACRGFILVAALLFILALPSHAQQSITIEGSVGVFDGDTLEIGPVLIRLHGIDAPERSQTCVSKSGGTWKCGAAATLRLDELIAGGDIACTARDRDPYGRIISRCSVNGIELAASLIEDGLAWAFTEFSTEFVDLEERARQSRLGVWQAETQTPWDYRDDKWNRALAKAPDGKCPIKGNISTDKGKPKIYHTPWSANYGNTKIDVAKGERWFCNEAEALAAGWRPIAGR